MCAESVAADFQTCAICTSSNVATRHRFLYGSVADKELNCLYSDLSLTPV